jgi:hypothetical protein
MHSQPRKCSHSVHALAHALVARYPPRLRLFERVHAAFHIGHVDDLDLLENDIGERFALIGCECAGPAGSQDR